MSYRIKKTKKKTRSHFAIKKDEKNSEKKRSPQVSPRRVSGFGKEHDSVQTAGIANIIKESQKLQLPDPGPLVSLKSRTEHMEYTRSRSFSNPNIRVPSSPKSARVGDRKKLTLPDMGSPRVTGRNKYRGLFSSRVSRPVSHDTHDDTPPLSERTSKETLFLRKQVLGLFLKQLPIVGEEPNNLASPRNNEVNELWDGDLSPFDFEDESFKTKPNKRAQDIRQSSIFRNLIDRAEGWNIELSYNNSAPRAYHVELARWYTEHYKVHDHINIMACGAEADHVVISIIKEYNKQMKLIVFRVLVRTDDGDQNVLVPSKLVDDVPITQISSVLLSAANPDIADMSFVVCHDALIKEKLLDFETKQVPNKFKFGVLLSRPGQRREEEMFGNTTVPNSPFEYFLDYLGDRVRLKGWDKFAGGLDTNSDQTGAYSVYTNWKDNQIMFHVSTLLPFETRGKQQVERKRHLGNDIVLIVFNEGVEPFVPPTVVSQFIHVVFVISVAEKDEKGRATSYRLSISSKEGVPWFGPRLPRTGMLPRTPESRNFLMYKLVNAELASFRAPQFVTRLKRVRETLLDDIVKTCTPQF